MRRPRHAVAPLDTGANIDRDLAVVLVKTVPCRDPRHQLGGGAIAVEKVEWLVEELITDARNTTRHEGIESIVILDLAAAGAPPTTNISAPKAPFPPSPKNEDLGAVGAHLISENLQYFQA